MKNAHKLNWEIYIPDVNLREQDKFQWRTAYGEGSAERVSKSPAAAKNAPTLPSVTPSYYVLPVEDSDLFIEQLPKRIVAEERPVVVYTVLQAASPSQLCIHKDWGWACSINIYIETTNEITTFYKFDKEAATVFPIESFCAEPKDVWAMRSKTPHGVVFSIPATRKLVNYSFRKLTYENLLELI